MKNKNYIDLAVAVAGIFGMGYGLAMTKKASTYEDILRNRADEMLKDENIDIRQSIVDDAIERHIKNCIGGYLDSSIKNACTKAGDQAMHRIYESIDSETRKVVSDTYNDMSRVAKVAIERELRDIDVSALKKEVKEEAKEAALKKFNSSLDDLLEEQNEKLKSVNRIYESIESSITKK